MFQIIADRHDYLLCNPYDEIIGANTDIVVKVAKPWELQTTPFNGEDAVWDDRDGWTHIYSSPSLRIRRAQDGFAEGQKVDPKYLPAQVDYDAPGDIIHATANIEGGTGVFADENALVWLDDNRGARRWISFNYGVFLVAGKSLSNLNSYTSDVDAYVPDDTTDTTGGVWITQASLPEAHIMARNATAGFVLIDRGYIVSGATGPASHDNADLHTDHTLEYANGVWTDIASLNTDRSNAVGAAVGGKGYVLGGARDDGGTVEVGSVEEFSNRTWTEKNPITVAAWTGQTGVRDAAGFHTSRRPENPTHDIYLCGGENQLGSQLDAIVKWNPAGGGNTVLCGATLKPEGDTRRWAAATAVGLKGFVFGGFNSGGGGNDYAYNTEINTERSVQWPTTVNRQPLTSIRQQASAFTVNDKAYIVGGWLQATAVSIRTCERFTPLLGGALGTWDTMTSLPAPGRFSMGVMNLIEGG
jgi:hypothetical protein